MIEPDGRNLVFILSTPRAGSTLLGAMLGSHSEVLCPPEQWLLLPLSAIRGVNAIITPYDQHLADKALRQFVDDNLFYQAACAFALVIYNSRLTEVRKSIFVDKTPRYYHILPFLDSLFPQARKIWLKRNPLDVVASCKAAWGLDVAELMGRSLSPYSFDVTISLSLLDSYFSEKDSAKIVVKYEDLVQNPESHMRSLCDFLNLPFEDTMLRYGDNQNLMFLYRHAAMGDKRVIEHLAPHTQSLNRWRELLTPQETQEVIQTLGTDIFKRLGYKEVIDEIAARKDIITDLSAGGKLEQLFAQYTSFTTIALNRLNEVAERTVGGGVRHTLIARQNAQLREQLRQSEADRAARLEVIQAQGAEIGSLHAEIGSLHAEIERLRTFMRQAMPVTHFGFALPREVKRIQALISQAEAQAEAPSDEESLQDNSYYASIREPKRATAVEYGVDTENRIIEGLQSLGFEVQDLVIDVAEYHDYFAKARYLEDYSNYYPFNTVERFLEHYIAARLLKLHANDIYIDIASGHSPVPQIYNRLFGCRTYRQDLAYLPGLYGDQIGGDAANMPIPDGFATKMALQCSFEHFEGDSDIRFIQEAARVLKPGGAVCIVPLYLFEEYAIQTDPAVSVPAGVEFEDEAVVHCAKNWNNRHARFYDPVHLKQRVGDNLTGLTMTIYRITNAKQVDASCYIRFAALFRKP